MPLPTAHPGESLRVETALRRRAFTLPELVMAMVIASAVLGATLGLIGAMNRADHRSMRRSSQSHQLGMLQERVRRALSSIVMSDAQQPTDIDPTQEQQPGEFPVGSRDVPVGFREDGLYEEGLRPRLYLYADREPLRADRDNAFGRSTLIRQTPQRFELVVSRPPQAWRPTVVNGRIVRNPFDQSILDRDRDDRRRDRQSLADANRMQAEESGAVRGCFELRPDDPDVVRAGAERGMTLWWRELPPGGPDDVALDPTVPIDIGFPLATGLLECQWKVMYRRQRRLEHAANWAIDLPAYVELRIETTSGIAVEWMFEVGWGNGPERGVDSDRGDNEDDDGEGDDIGEPQPPVDPNLPRGLES